MKKILLLLTFILVLSVYLFAQNPWVDTAKKVYDEVPEAEYYVTAYVNGTFVSSTTVNSCGLALSYARQYFGRGATSVDIKSKYPTVNLSCDKSYYSVSDLP
ncbi:hypothetical protein [Brachyspira innocens]|uniref:hypothetical protein n=1 Tax=Brachyspira innocens TaxID=13264 RepID=UPI0026F35B57|nr:hypothetical protein [Brachyspira innocens]